MADYGLDGKLRKAFDFLALVNQTAYNNIYLLSNEALSKNPFTSKFLDKFLKGEMSKPQGILKIFSIIMVYYAKSFVYFGIYLLFFIAFKLSRLKYAADRSFKELILIDTYFLVDRIKKSRTYEDPYFIGLENVLEKLGKHYAYLPVFYTTKNPLKLFDIFRILKKNSVPVLTEYQLLSGRDLLRIFSFLLIYPIEVLIFAKNIKGDTYEAELLKSELVDNLKYASFLKFSRYLQGRKIGMLPYEEIKVISWFENQTIDKNLYKGIRKGNNKIKIYGAQPFLAPKIIMNVLVDENEARFGIVPDKILVNGSYFLPKNTTLHFSLGPSFRYKSIFTTTLDENNRNDLLIILSYFIEDTMNILKLLKLANISGQNILVKSHPSVPAERLKGFLPVNATIACDNLYELFKTAKVVIGAASGALVEAASLGIPVISIKNIERFDYNSLPAYGKGIIWDEAINSGDIEKLLAKFESALKNAGESDKIKKIADEYKKMFFCQPTEENIIKAYELDH